MATEYVLKKSPRGKRGTEYFLWILLIGHFAVVGWGDTPAYGKSVRNPYFQFQFHEKDEAYMKGIVSRSPEIFRKMTRDIGFRPKTPIMVILASDRTEWNQFQPPGHPLPDWAAGVAYAHINTMVLPSPRILKMPNPDPLKTFVHELTHLVLSAGFEGRPVPRWLNEGIAMYESYEWHPAQDLRMARAVLAGEVIPVREFPDAFKGNRDNVQLAYFQAYSLVHYIQSEFGREAFHRLVHHLAEGMSIESALNQALGIPAETLETRWKRYLKFRFNWVPFLTSSVMLWGVISLSLFGVYWARKRRNRKIMEQWEEEERYHRDFSGNNGNFSG